MSQFGPGDRPPAATKPKRKAKRKAKPSAPSPAVKEQHAAVAQAHATNHKRAENVRKARSEVPSAPVRQPGLPPEVKNPVGSTLPAPKPGRPTTFVDILDKKQKAASDKAQREATQREIDHHVGLLMTTGRSLHKQEQSIERLKHLGVLPGTSDFQKAVDRFRAKRQEQAKATHKQSKDDIFLADPEALKAAGFKREGDIDKALRVPGVILPTLAASAVQTARATYEDPLHVVPKTAAGLGKMVVGAPAGVADIVLNPSHLERLPKALRDDINRRYGDVIKDPKKFRERIKKEGAAPELVDAATFLSGPASAGGKGLVKVAEEGALGKTAQRVITKPRAVQRISGNITHTPERSNKITRIIAGKVADKLRQRRTAKRAAKPTAPAHVREAVANGEVTPLLERTPVIGRRARARKAVARQKSVTHQQRRAETEREVNQGAEKNLASLRRPERSAFKYAIQLGLRGDDPRSAVAALERRKTQIAHERAANPDVEIIDGEDELVVIDKLIKNASKAFTPRLAKVVREERERGKRTAEGDPGIKDEEAALRRVAPQAEHLGVVREGTPVDGALKAGKAELKTAKKARKRAGKAVTRQERAAGRSQGRSEVRAAQADTKMLRGDEAYVEAARGLGKAQREMREAKAAYGNAHRNPDMWTAAERHAIEQRAAQAERDLATARSTYRTSKAAAVKRLSESGRDAEGNVTRPPILDRKPTGSLRVTERNEAEALRRQLDAAEADKAVAAAKAKVRKAKKAKRKGERLVDAEPADQFIGRVRQEAERQGLEEPGYHPSQKRPESTFGAFTTGGKKRTPGPQEYEGVLYRTGRESNDPRVYTTSLAQSIKRKYNWNMVGKTFDDNSYEWSKGKTLGELKDELKKKGIDPESVAFWNPQIFREAREKLERADEHSELTHGETLGDTHVHAAAQQAAIDWDKLATSRDEFNLKGGWSLVPKEVYDEIMADTHPSNFLGRSFHVAKGKASRLLLANPVWLQFQIAGNAFLTGISGTGPIDALKAQVWWHKLSPEERDAIEPYIGVHAFHDEQTRLGATSTNRFVNGYRAFKSTSFYKIAHKANPLDLIFKADNKQNNFFRKAVLYNKVKRSAYKRMGENVGQAQALQARIVNIMKLGPDEQMREIIANRKLFEQHAQHVNDFLGDYTTYTARERRILGRGVMFYGFMRFSVRFMFYTLPAKHPLTASVMLKLGQLHHDEIVRIFGTDPPPWELGNYYSPDGKTKIAVQRLNPFFNTGQFIDLDTGELKVNQAMGLVPPFAQAAANQVAGKNIFLNKNWQVGGSTTEARHFTAEDRGKILVADLLKGWGAAYSTASRLDPELRGKQGADSSLLFPSPIEYKRGDAKRRNEERIDRQSKPLGTILREAVTPVQDGREAIITTREYEAQTKKKKKATRGGGGTGVNAGGGSAFGVNVGGGSGQLGVRP